MDAKFAIIGGTGLYELDFVEKVTALKAQTKYGEVRLYKGYLKKNGAEVFFMARHGSTHSIAPHLINYRANIAALKLAGVNSIISTNAVGSLRKEMPPGALVIIDQFVDFTKTRQFTFIGDEDYPVTHLDYTEPYCGKLRELLIKEAVEEGLAPVRGGTYVCTEGPRFETTAEIRMYARLGGDLVGMTNVPEVVLAREAGICYATAALVTNFAAGISPSSLTHEEVLEVMAAHREKINTLFQVCLEKAAVSDEYEHCSCHDAGRLFKVEGRFL